MPVLIIYRQHVVCFFCVSACNDASMMISVSSSFFGVPPLPYIYFYHSSLFIYMYIYVYINLCLSIYSIIVYLLYMYSIFDIYIHLLHIPCAPAHQSITPQSSCSFLQLYNGSDLMFASVFRSTETHRRFTYELLERRRFQQPVRTPISDEPKVLGERSA